MNETSHPASMADVPWPTTVPHLPVPETAMLPDNEQAAPAAAAARQRGAGVSAAAVALEVKPDPVRQARDQWVEGARTRVRSNPLACIAAALALGAVIARTVRIGR